MRNARAAVSSPQARADEHLSTRHPGTLDMRRVEFLDHLDAGATIFGDLIDVVTLHQPHANIGMAQAVGGARLFATVAFEPRAR